MILLSHRDDDNISIIVPRLRRNSHRGRWRAVRKTWSPWDLWAGCPTRRVPIFLRAIHRPPSIRDRRRSGKRQRPSVGFPPFFFAGIGQRSEKCDWPRREQLSFVVQVFRRCPFRTCVEFHTGRFPPSEIQFFESLNNQPLHGSYCLLVMPVCTPEKAY